VYRSKPLLLLALGCALMASGCASSTHNSDGTPKAKNFPADGYMGITSVNPNDPMNPGYHHYRDDARLMRTVIAGIPGVKDSTIRINGANATVNLALDRNASDQEAERIRGEASRALSQNMPRYNVTVTTSRR
jgi:hypothetical protein